MSSVAPPRPLAPLGGAVVDRMAVTFQWEGIAGAHAYEFEVAPDRQFARGAVRYEAGPSTDLTLVEAVPATDAPLFWRVRARTSDGVTRWSPYGRFQIGSDAAIDAFHARQEAERIEARKAELRRRTAEAAELDLLPYTERDDTIPSDRNAGGIGLAMVLSLLIVLFGTLIATFMAS